MPIVVGVAEGELSKRALARAVEEAKLRGDGLVLVTSVTKGRNENDEEYAARRQQAEELLRERIAELGAHGVAADVEVPVAPSSHAQGILDVAATHDTSLIVIGIPRRSPVGKVVLGSTAQDVILGAHAPVLGVKAPEQ